MRLLEFGFLLFLCFSHAFTEKTSLNCKIGKNTCKQYGRGFICYDNASWRCTQECLEGCRPLRIRDEERCICSDDDVIDKLASSAGEATGEFAEPSSQINSHPSSHNANIGKVDVQKVQHSPHHSNEEKLRIVQSKAKDVAEDIATTNIIAPPVPARHLQDKKANAIIKATSMADIYFLAVVTGCSVAGLVGLVIAGVCWYKLQKNVKAASEAEYPAYGVTGPTKERLGSPGDRKLAQSAQMYHYQHQKQQMIALEKANGEMKHDGSDEDSDEENEEGDYTVYECPGLAPTGEMEVRNPLFSEETPVTPTPGDEHSEQK